MDLSKCFIYQEKSDLSYIMVDVNWKKWRAILYLKMFLIAVLKLHMIPIIRSLLWDRSFTKSRGVTNQNRDVIYKSEQREEEHGI